MTKKCEAALQCFRPSHPRESRVLWIDSLCINQKDIEERGQEVGIMGPIYAKAKQVLIWLGTGIEPTNGITFPNNQRHHDAFDWMVRVADAAEERGLEGGMRRFAWVVEELKNLGKTRATYINVHACCKDHGRFLIRRTGYTKTLLHTLTRSRSNGIHRLDTLVQTRMDYSRGRPEQNGCSTLWIADNYLG